MSSAWGKLSNMTSKKTATSNENASVNVEIPFDLNAIFTLTFDYEGLKKVIEHIFKQLGQNAKKTQDLEIKLSSKFMALEKVQKDNEEIQKELQKQRMIQEELEQKSVCAEEDISALKTDNEMSKMNINLMNRNMNNIGSKLDKLIEDLTKAGVLDGNFKAGDAGDAVDGDRLNDLMARVQDLKERVNNCEESCKQNANGLDILAQKLNQDEQNIDQNKTQCIQHSQTIQIHQQEISSIKTMISKLGSSGGSGEPLENAVALGMRIDSLESLLNQKEDKDVVARLDEKKADWDILKKYMQENDNRMESMRQHLDMVDRKISNMNNNLEQHDQRIDMLEQKMENGMRNQVNIGGDDEGTNQKFNELYHRMSQCEHDINELKMEFSKWIKEFQDGLNNKADLSELKNLEAVFMQKLDVIVMEITKKFADKNDTKKALKILERQLKNLYDLFMQRQGGQGGENEDDAMFTKKPLGGVSCASCEKDIINMYGKKVDYLPWNKMPIRDPSERIARVGQGFSKMLSMINPDQLSRYDGKVIEEEGQQQMFNQQPGGRGFYNDDGGIVNHASSSKMKSLKTQSNFYQAGVNGMERRPGSAQVLARPRVRGASKKKTVQ